MIQPENVILWLAIGSLAGICLFISMMLVWRSSRRDAGLRQISGEASPRPRRLLNWTMAPVFALALAAVALTSRLYFQDANPTADLTVMMSGKMWFWTYKYPDHGNFSFKASMLTPKGTSHTIPDEYDHIVVPVGKTVRIVAVANDVIYSWAIPAIGASIEAVPGRTEQSWFRAEDEGRFFGNCLELCGLPHSFKPIEIEVVSQDRFDRWVAGAKQKLTPVVATRSQKYEVP